MGGLSFNCYTDICNQNTILFDQEINYALMEDPKYQQYSKEFFKIFNNIRANPDKFIAESKEHSLLGPFIKQKPSKEINLCEGNIKNIKKFLIYSHLKNKTIYEQEQELKPFIDNGHAEDISLFQTICNTNNSVNENVWTFLLENEDDFDKIFSIDYNKLIICI